MSLLSVEKLHFAYGKIEAVRGVSLRVETNEVVAIVGANGAGKTTLLNAIAGLTVPRAGRVLFQDREITGLSAQRVVRLGISLVPEGRQLFPEHSVMVNLELGAFHRRRDGRAAIAKDMETVFSLFPRLYERRQQTAGTLSGGEQQMLAIGRSLMARPKLLILDEPSIGLAPQVTAEIFRSLESLKGWGMSTLLVDQNAVAALQLSSRAYVMETGQVVLEGEASELAQDARVQEIYLGVADHQPLGQTEEGSA